jgi:hypothetical protein
MDSVAIFQGAMNTVPLSHSKTSEFNFYELGVARENESGAGGINIWAKLHFTTRLLIQEERW